MQTLDNLYDEFSALATVTEPATRPPSLDDLTRTAIALGRHLPHDFVKFLTLFYDRHPPFWDVLRVQSAGEPDVLENIVETNLALRKLHPLKLQCCLLFKNIGTGDYDCFVFTPEGQVAGIGVWEQFTNERGEPPSVLYATWFDWFAAEMQDLRGR